MVIASTGSKKTRIPLSYSSKHACIYTLDGAAGSYGNIASISDMRMVLLLIDANLSISPSELIALFRAICCNLCLPAKLAIPTGNIGKKKLNTLRCLRLDNILAHELEDNGSEIGKG